VPTGFWDSLNPAARFIEWIQPKHVLDIGIGNGRMGFLAREYGDKEGIERWRPGKQIVDGIEGYAPYLGPLQKAIYDRILVGEARELLPTLTERYELAIAADILEHFDHGSGLEFLTAALSAADVLLVSTPSFFMEQQSEANPLENHRSFWSLEALRDANAGYVEAGPMSNFALFGDAEIIVAYAAGVERRPTWKDWLVPPELCRLIRETRARAHRGTRP